MLIRVDGALAAGVTAKDLALAIIRRSAPTAAPATPSSTPATPSARSSMEGRMTLCNIAIESGARAGMVAPDETTFAYVKGRPYAPQGEHGRRPSPTGAALPSDPGANSIASWGSTPRP